MNTLDASHLFNWADTGDASLELPRLIRLLVMETVPIPPSHCDMPSGSSTRLPGWDGTLSVESGNPWVPSGFSAWEMSCEKNPGSKATRDYDKRTSDPNGVDVPQSTFVFVTLRRWARKRKWVDERKESCPWADVRVLDADNLIQWLDRAPTTAAWLRETIDKRPPVTEEIQKLTSRIDAGFAGLGPDIVSQLKELVQDADRDGKGKVFNPEHRELEIKIDSARNSIGRGYIHSARAELENLRDQHDTMPPGLEFRIVTNLGACAMAEENYSDARAFFEEAYRIQPEDQKGIANAALAAHLGKDRRQAVHLAMKARQLDPENPQATIVLLREYWETEKTEELEEFVTSNEWLLRDRQCVSVLAGIRVEQSRFEEAVTLCRSLIEADSEEAEHYLTLAECLFSCAQAGRVNVGHTEESLAQLYEAEAAASKAIELLEQTDLVTRTRSALVIRAVILFLLGETTRTLCDLDRVLGEDPEHVEAAYNKGLVLLREDRPAEARTLFENIQECEKHPDVVFPLADACIASGDPSAAVKLLKETVTLECLEWMDIHRAEILSQAEKEAGVEDSLGGILNAALERLPTNPRLLALKSTHCEIYGDAEGAEQSLLEALKHSDGSDRRQIELRLATLYHSQRRFAEAAELFEGIVDSVASHPFASTLLHCLISSKQLRKALNWAREIKNTSSEPPKLALEVEVEVLRIVGDVPAAVSCLLNICQFEGATAGDRVRLAEAQYRCGERDAALETAQCTNSLELINEPQSLMKLAQLKFLLGSTDFLDDAYRALRHAIDDPAVHKGYGGLFLACQKNWTEPKVVGPGCAVLLENESGPRWWYILEEGEDPRGPHDLSSTNGLGAVLIGQREGKTVVLRQDLEKLSYRIAKIQSKFVRAFQETVEEFSTRFPDDLSLSRIEIKDDDFTKVFQSVEQGDEFDRNALRVYQEGKVPFVSLCSLLRKSFLDVWLRLTCEDSGLIAGDGTYKEAKRADSIVRDTQNVVLDLVALLTVHSLGIAENLRDHFSRIAVPQYVLDDIYDAISEAKFTGQPAGYLGKSTEGYYTLDETTEAAWNKRQEYLESLRDLAESFERIPSYRVLEIDDLEDIKGALTSVGVGSVFAGYKDPERSSVLISDDLVLAQFARSRGISVVNTEAVLHGLYRTDGISGEAYSSYIEQLAMMNYKLIRVSSEDILRRLEANDYVTSVGLRAMFKTLEGPDYSTESAVLVGAEVIAALADRAYPRQVNLILSAILLSLQRGRDKCVVLGMFQVALERRLAHSPSILHQLLKTVDEHYRLT